MSSRRDSQHLSTGAVRDYPETVYKGVIIEG
jgi:hypothetical protein